MSLDIHGIGTAVPEHAIDQQHAAELARAFCCQSAERVRLLPWLYRRSGVLWRHSVLLEAAESAVQVNAECGVRNAECDAKTSRAGGKLSGGSTVTQSFYEPMAHPDDCGPTTAQRMQAYERTAGGLAARAGAAALEQAGIAAAEITHLITVSCTGFAAPGVDWELLRLLELPATTARTHIGFMGCHGVLNALRVAAAFAAADRAARVLICAVELCSLHQQYGWHPDRIVANALFADGAAALVAVQSGGSANRGWRVAASGSTILPETADLMSWRIGDHGYEMTLSPRVPDVIRQALRPWLSQWLGRHGLDVVDIGSWAIHPGGPRILKACGEALRLDGTQLEPSQRILAEYGNMSSPTVLFILQQLMRAAAPRPCVMLAFGPGLTVEAALVG
jgi:prepilin-type processing-associated H-X9-DG protein